MQSIVNNLEDERRVASVSKPIIKFCKTNVLLMYKTEEWQSLINKPVISDDEGAMGVVTEIQPLHIIVSAGPVTANKYNIPKEMVSQFENGIVYLTLTQKDIEENYKFE